MFELTFHRLKQAAANPDELDLNTVISNMDPAEAARLQRVRNIGIAVSSGKRRALLSTWLME